MQLRASIVARLAIYYVDNPDEELTFSFIAAKFDCTLWTARRAVYDLVARGVLESVHVIRLREKGIAKEPLQDIA